MLLFRLAHEIVNVILWRDFSFQKQKRWKSFRNWITVKNISGYFLWCVNCYSILICYVISVSHESNQHIQQNKWHKDVTQDEERHCHFRIVLSIVISNRKSIWFESHRSNHLTFSFTQLATMIYENCQCNNICEDHECNSVWIKGNTRKILIYLDNFEVEFESRDV